MARRTRGEEGLHRLAQDLRRHALAAVGDGDPAGRPGGTLDAGQLGDHDRAGRRGVAGVAEQVGDGALQLARIDEDGAADAEAQLEDPFRAERILELWQPRRQRLMCIETLHARRADAGEGLELAGEANPAFEAGSGHPHDGAARGGRIDQAVDAVRQHLQDVGELVTDHRGDAAQRLDVAHPVEPLGADLQNRRLQPFRVRSAESPLGSGDG